MKVEKCRLCLICPFFFVVVVYIYNFSQIFFEPSFILLFFFVAWRRFHLNFIALSSRCLQLILRFVPYVKSEFESHLNEEKQNLMRHIIKVTRVSTFGCFSHGFLDIIHFNRRQLHCLGL